MKGWINSIFMNLCSRSCGGLGRNLPAETFDHAGQIFSRKYGIVDDQIADRLPVFAAFYWCDLLHTDLPFLLHYHAHSGRNQITLVTGFSCADPLISRAN